MAERECSSITGASTPAALTTSAISPLRGAPFGRSSPTTGATRSTRPAPTRNSCCMLIDRRAVAVTAVLVLATLSLTGCFSCDASEPVTKAGRAASALGERMRLQLLVYNIQYGGGPATDRVIRQVDADVVGVL